MTLTVAALVKLFFKKKKKIIILVYQAEYVIYFNKCFHNFTSSIKEKGHVLTKKSLVQSKMFHC